MKCSGGTSMDPHLRGGGRQTQTVVGGISK
jgi:hypothetical protein